VTAGNAPDDELGVTPCRVELLRVGLVAFLEDEPMDRVVSDDKKPNVRDAIPGLAVLAAGVALAVGGLLAIGSVVLGIATTALLEVALAGSVSRWSVVPYEGLGTRLLTGPGQLDDVRACVGTMHSNTSTGIYLSSSRVILNNGGSSSPFGNRAAGDRSSSKYG
jgi:hypothetical protein